MNRKIRNLLVIVLLLVLLSISGRVSAANIVIKATSDSYLKAGDIVEVTLSISEIDTGISAFVGTLVYDTNVFEEVTDENFEALNRWNLPTYNSTTGQFSTTRNSAVNAASDMFKITLKAKDTISVDKTTITFKTLIGSDGAETGDIEIKADVNIEIKKDPATIETNTTTNEIANEVTNEITNKVNTVTGNQTTNKITSNVTNATTGKLPQTGEGIEIAVGIAVISVVAVIAFMKYRNLNIK